MPAGEGGEIHPGTYVLAAITEHEARGCSPVAGNTFRQTLMLRASEGAVVDDDDSHLHWAGRFTYATEGTSIAITMTCNTGSNHAPWGPFGPFDTYTATGDRLALHSRACGFRAEFRLLLDQVP